jgi:hypothetical protein
LRVLSTNPSAKSLASRLACPILDTSGILLQSFSVVVGPRIAESV